MAFPGLCSLEEMPPWLWTPGRVLWGGASSGCGQRSFPSPVDHVLSEPSTMTHLSCIAQHGLACSFTDLCKKALHHDKAVIHEGEGLQREEQIKPRVSKTKEITNI